MVAMAPSATTAAAAAIGSSRKVRVLDIRSPGIWSMTSPNPVRLTCPLVLVDSKAPCPFSRKPLRRARREILAADGGLYFFGRQGSAPGRVRHAEMFAKRHAFVGRSENAAPLQ